MPLRSKPALSNPLRRAATAAALSLLLFLSAVPAAFGAARPKEEQDRIDWLVKCVQDSDAVFIRNGQEHTASAAASHLKSKLWFAGKRVQTVKDFIEGVASHSEETGRPYEIRPKGGKLQPMRDWLYARLAELEKERRK